MRQTVLARRYAAALLMAAQSADVMDRVESDLGLVTQSLQAVPRLQDSLLHPLIPGAEKKRIVAEVFGGKVDDVTLHFLDLLIDKQRNEVMAGVEEEYIRLANEFRGIASAVATSAVRLTKDEQDQLRAKLEELTGKKIELEFEQDTSLIGGLVVRIGDTIMDGSVTGYLASLRETLLE